MKQIQEPRFAAIAKRLLDARQLLNLGRAEIARRAGIHYTELVNFEAGERVPSEDRLEKLAKALQVKPGDLMTDAERANRPKKGRVATKPKVEKPKREKKVKNSEPKAPKKIGRPLKTEIISSPSSTKEAVPIKEEPKMHVQIQQPVFRELPKTPARELNHAASCRSVSMINNKIQVCMLPIQDGGINGSGFCEECYSPENVERYELYRSLLAEKYTPREAASMAGLTDLF